MRDPHKRSWLDELLFRWFPYPPKYVARAECRHALECYMCEPDRCTGGLNEPRDPDMDKPRSGSGAMSVPVPSSSGGINCFLVPLESYNQRLRDRRAPDDPLPNADPLPPGVAPDRQRWSFRRYWHFNG